MYYNILTNNESTFTFERDDKLYLANSSIDNPRAHNVKYSSFFDRNHEFEIRVIER